MSAKSIVMAASGATVPPTFVASSFADAVSTNAVTVNKPTGTTTGDLMIAFMTMNAGRTWTGDTGWTEILEQGAAQPALRVAYKVAGASEGASYTFTANTAGGNPTAAILTYRRAAYGTTGNIAINASPLVVTGPTVEFANSLLLGFIGRAATSITITGPVGMTTRLTDNNATTPSMAAFEEAVGAGSPGTRSFVVGSSSSVAGVLVVLRPA